MIDNDALKEMIDQVDLFEYASQSFHFTKRSGDNWFCSCPLHVDKTPSLAVNTRENYFHCFSCGVGGDIISWMKTFEGLSFSQAVKKLGNITGTDLSKLEKCESLSYFKKIRSATLKKQEHDSKERVYLNEDSYNMYSTKLPVEWIDEGISENAMRRFGVRIDDNANRIVYPVYDANYKYICPKGRTRFKNYKEIGITKYINYSKIGTTDFFVGMKENCDAIMKNHKIIIFEGIKSVMKAYDWGYDYCVSAETSTVNDDQVKLLIKMGIKDATIAFDSDVNAEKIIESTRVLRRFTKVYMIKDRRGLLGEKESPADRGKDVFETLLNERIDISGK